MINVPDDWWRDFFTGVFVDMWLQAVPEERTREEAAFIQKMLRVGSPARLLDVPCGGGRHSLALAAAGYTVTGVDISADFLAAARSRSAAQGLAVAWVQQGMRGIAWQDAFDGAFCFGNAFGYDDDAGNAAFLKGLVRALKPGARFVLDYPMVLEARLPKFQERNWFQLGDIYFIEDEHYDPVQGRIVTEYTLLRNSTETKRPACHRTYTYRQVCELLADAGFADVQTYGTMNEEPFRLGSDCLYLVGTKKPT